MDLLNIIAEYYLVLILVTVITVLFYVKQPKNLPPGPIGLPIVGYFPFLKGPPHLAITELGKKYGSVISFYLGSVLVIALNDYDAIKEAFVKQGNLFSGKPEANVFRVEKDDKGLVLAEGEAASQHRRFILSSFRDFGMGKTSLEPQLLDEIKYFLEELKKQNGKPVYLKPFLSSSVSNVIAMLEFGKRFEYSDAEFFRLKELMTSSGKFIGAVAIRIFLPWIKYIPFTEKLTNYNHLKKSHKIVRDYFVSKLEENERNYVEGSKNHFIDGYLTERNAIIKKTGSEGHFNKGELVSNLGGLFSAGTETTTGILQWSIIYLLKYPEIGEKVLAEIDKVIGQSRDPAFIDKNNMPYTDAYLLEVHRHSSLIPFTLVHSNYEEATLYGFTIPKRSYIIGNLWAVHHDKKLWKNPDEFNPDRFINEEGKVVKPEYLIPFSIGKRNCIGEPLANMEIFLYFTTLLQNFKVQVPEGETVSMESEFGIGLNPKPYKICVIAK